VVYAGSDQHLVSVYNVTEVLRVCWKPGDTRWWLILLTVFFTFVVPVAFLTTVPAEAMLGRVQLGWVVGAGVLALGLCCGAGSSLRFYQCFQLKEESRG